MTPEEIAAAFPECEPYRGVPHQYQNCTHQRLTPEKCDRWRVAQGLEPKHSLPTGVVVRKARRLQTPVREPVGTILEELAESLDVPEQEGCTCPQIRDEMNALGVAGCIRERDRLVAAIRENVAGVSLWARIRAIPHAIAAGLSFKVNPRDPAPGLFDEAVRRAEERRVKKKSIPIQKSCCQKQSSRIETTPRSSGPSQKTIVLRQKRPKPISQVEYTGPVTRHLIYHLWPAARTDQWKWNLSQLLKRISIFNGKRVVGVAIDPSTVTIDEVREFLSGHNFQFVVVPNNAKQGETATFNSMMGLVRTDDPNAIIFYGHGKGTSCGPKGQKSVSGGSLALVRKWTEAMYDACLDDVARVDKSLERHIFSGSFRRFERGNRWFYSGAFFWMRACHTFSRNWKVSIKQRFAVEFWPQTISRPEDSYCLCADNVGRLYDPKQLDASVKSCRRLIGSRSEQSDPVLPPIPQPVYEDGVTLITPTGDRHAAFALCERWIGQQTYQGPLQWIVVDDGQRPTSVSMGQEYVRRNPSRKDPPHTLCRNVLEALPLVRHNKILIIEDDDFYSAGYVAHMADALDKGDLVGEFGAKYYYLRTRFYHYWANHKHASLCRTGFRSNAIPVVQQEAKRTDQPSLDMRLWSAWNGTKHSWRDPHGAMSIGIKGMPGRGSVNSVPARGSVADPGLTQLRRWLGDDAEAYRDILSGPKPAKSSAKIVCYTAVFGAFDLLPNETPHNPDVQYLAFTDKHLESIPDPWMRHKVNRTEPDHRRQNRFHKLLSHQMFPDADWTIYVDGNMRLLIDPVELIRYCERCDPDAVLFHCRHDKRTCLYVEGEYCITIKKDRKEVVRPQLDRYRAAGFPQNSGLYLGGFMVRRRGCEQFNESWWREVQSGSCRDQISLPFALRKTGVKNCVLPKPLTDFVELFAHKVKR